MISNLCLGFGNSSLELHFADFGIFWASQTPSLVSAPKIPKNYESQTENPSVVDSLHESSKNQSARSANPIKSFCYFWLSPKVESPFFIDLALDLQSIRATNRNGRNCGGGFVFVRIFGAETRLGVCERPKILTSAKDAPKSELTRNDAIFKAFLI